MGRIKFIVALGVVMAAMLALSAGTAMADDGRHHNDGKRHDDGKHHDKFFDHDKKFFIHDDFDFDFEPVFVDVDVDFEKVPPRSALVGECFVTDIDGNGFIDDWEVEVTCFVPRRWW